MTTPAFTYEGLDVRTLTEIKQELVDAYKTIYGNDINLGDSTPDGQRVGIEAKAIADIEEFLLNLYNQMDADLAFGEWLNKLIKFAGIQRKPATRSTVEMTIVTDRILTLPENYTLEDELGQEWILTASASLVSGSNTVTFVAKEFGSIGADANTITEQADVVIGVVSVTNPAIAVEGLDEETDAELRLRRAKSVENPAYSTVGGLYSRLADLAGVTDVVVEENDEDTDDAARSLTAHTIWCIVEGGESTDIVETIAKNRTAGIRTKGSESGIYIETLLRPNGDEFEIQHEMNYDRPTYVDLYITLTATRTNASSPIDTALIKQKLESRAYLIQENARASELYSLAYQAGTNFILSDLEISDDNVTFTDEDLISDYGAKFVIDSANVTINEVIP
jgi:uncharacterized phage protein gp47/JayE